MAGGRLPACKKEGFRRAQGDSAVERPSRAKSKTNNTGDSHVVTHRSTNPAITCLYMAERTGCLAFTYLWSFVLDLHVSQLIYLHPPPHTAASSRVKPMSQLPGATLPSTADVHRQRPRWPSARGESPAGDQRLCLYAQQLVAMSQLPGATLPSSADMQKSIKSIRPIHSPPGAGSSHLISPSTNGEVFNKSSG